MDSRQTSHTEELKAVQTPVEPPQKVAQTPMPAPVAAAKEPLESVLAPGTFQQKPGAPRRTPARLIADGCAFIIMCARAYGGMLVAMGMLLPLTASIVTLAIFMFLPPSSGSNWSTLLFGAVFTYLGWLIVSAFFAYFASAEGANTRSYYMLRSRLYGLKARLGIIDGPDGRPQPMTLEEMQEAVGMEPSGNVIALREAYAAYAVINDILLDSHTGLAWILGIGYINSWSMIHRAEEALIEIEPLESVIGGAMHDQNCIQDSKMGNRHELLEKLTHAVKDLDPLALPYFNSQLIDRSRDALLNKVIQTTRTTSKRLEQLAQAVQKVDDSLQIDQQPEEHVEPLTERMPGSPEMQAHARIALREVRTALNEYRDNLWESLVRTRNRLLGTILLMGLVTHAMLSVAIMTNSNDTNRPLILGAAVYYLVGAVAGLFGRFYKELVSPSSVDDYHLSLVRMIATPILSGLAGVGGVLIGTLLYGTLLGVRFSVLHQLSIKEILHPSQSYYLLAAAIFGLAPNLLIKVLQQKAEEYVTSLRLSKSSETHSTQ
ncbi:MAG: hypothetical protein J2P37_15285 [Ktedonobacteraceae bacterium]|nr:hypothetical protein [Ktedonobacteraceae bacterium]